jgi:hypothetical protein
MELLPQLTQPYSMTSIIFLDPSETIYMNKTNDPWFSATTPYVSDGDEYTPDSFSFVADMSGGVLGCVTQRIYCNPHIRNMSVCIDAFGLTDLNGNEDEYLSGAWPNREEQDAIRPILHALSTGVVGNIDQLYEMSGVSALWSRATLYKNLQTAALPNNQWQLEREHIFKASLVATQSSLVEYARGVWYGAGVYCRAENTCQRVCNSQVSNGQFCQHRY